MSIDLNFQSIFLFFIFIVPGFVFTRTYISYRPRYFKEANAFEQTALALIGSTIIHATFLGAVTFAVLIVWFITGQNTTLGMITGPIMPATDYPLPILALYLNLATGYLLLTLLAARRFGIFLGHQSTVRSYKWWNRIVGEDPPDNLLLWYIVLQQEPLKRGIFPPKVTIRMRNSDHFEGKLNNLKLVGDEDNTIELVLSNVSYRSGKQDESTDLTDLPDQTILLSSSDILWLTRSDSLPT